MASTSGARQVESGCLAVVYAALLLMALAYVIATL
jgi:hypothetical protein